MTEKETQTIHTRLAVIETKLDAVLSKYVTREEFKPVKSIVYGLVTAVLLAFVGAVIALVLR